MSALMKYRMDPNLPSKDVAKSPDTGSWNRKGNSCLPSERTCRSPFAFGPIRNLNTDNAHITKYFSICNKKILYVLKSNLFLLKYSISALNCSVYPVPNDLDSVQFTLANPFIETDKDLNLRVPLHTKTNLPTTSWPGSNTGLKCYEKQISTIYIDIIIIYRKHKENTLSRTISSICICDPSPIDPNGVRFLNRLLEWESPEGGYEVWRYLTLRIRKIHLSKVQMIMKNISHYLWFGRPKNPCGLRLHDMDPT